jgi:hypothetical protein
LKFDLGQIIYYLRDNRLHSAPVLARTTVENNHGDWTSTKEQRELFTPFGPAGSRYGTCHGIVHEDEAHETREALFMALGATEKDQEPPVA